MASVRAHVRRVASCKEQQVSAEVRRASRPCESNRAHRLINLPRGTSKRPQAKAVHVAIA
eukprot:5609733-Pleurochrysis_carterae.AAC.1